MKNILKLIIILWFQNSFAQYPILTTTSLTGDPTMDANFLKSGNYAVDTNNERNQYVGLWRYQTSDILSWSSINHNFVHQLHKVRSLLLNHFCSPSLVSVKKVVFQEKIRLK